MTRAILPVIMSGGSGARLWPLSTEESPKQFHRLSGPLTMIQETTRRFVDGEALRFETPLIICNRRNWTLLKSQLQEIGFDPGGVVLEPVGRNTAAAATVASRLAIERYPGAMVLLAPADHVIAAPDQFRAAIASGASLPDRIVTFGVTPSRPETGYGYIQKGDCLGAGLFEVSRFVEKPGRDVAEALLREGGYLWNAGIFLFDPVLLLAEMAAHRPDILSFVDASLTSRARVAGEPEGVFELPPAFAETPSESIDKAVMERTRRAAVAPLDAGWADVGAWNEIWRLSEHDCCGNLVRGEAIVLDTSGSLVWSEGRLVATLGVEDLIVVATEDAVVVLPRSRSHEIKRVVEAVRARRRATDGGEIP